MPEPQRRPIPWSVIVITAIVAVGGTLIIRDIVKPPRGTAVPSSERGPILGLDDEATKKMERELYEWPTASASASASAPAPASVSASASAPAPSSR